VQNGMSALPPKADICTAMANVCFGPKADTLSGSRFPSVLLEFLVYALVNALSARQLRSFDLRASQILPALASPGTIRGGCRPTSGRLP